MAMAMATCVVAGAILLGPGLLQCSRDGVGAGACLRGKLERREPVVVPPVSAIETSTDNPRKPGWIEANANEYDVAPPARATLRRGEGVVLAAGAGRVAPAAGASVGLAASSGRLAALGAAPTLTGAGGAAVVAGSPGTLTASAGSMRSGVAGRVEMAMAAPGHLVAGGDGWGSVGVAGWAMALVVAPEPPGVMAVGGAGFAGARVLAQAEARFVVAAMASGTTRTAAKGVVSSPIGGGKVSPPPRRVLRNDPRFPSVIVLPPPARGKNSSFTTLKLR
jgi:hypothetical protein